jgi:hypothetical protein
MFWGHYVPETSRDMHMIHTSKPPVLVHSEGAVRLDYLSTHSCILIAGSAGA